MKGTYVPRNGGQGLTMVPVRPVKTAVVRGLTSSRLLSWLVARYQMMTLVVFPLWHEVPKREVLC